jgi:hypothetical protein
MKHFASGLLVTLLLSMPAFSAGTDDLSKAKAQVAFVYKRLAGAPASSADIDTWGAGLVAAADKTAYLTDVVAKAATDNDKFYSVTVLNFAQIEASEERALADGSGNTNSIGVLNDLTATVIGMVRDEKDYRAILSDDVLYIPTGATYAAGTNAIYDTLYANVKNGAPLASALTATTQTGATGLSVQAGIFTLRGFGSVYYDAGTNRAAFRFASMNYLCRDLEALSDVSRADIYVRKDVDRAPGGDATKYRTECVGCHAGMDPLANAFAYFDFIPPAQANQAAAITISATGVVPKMNQNADVFPLGKTVENDSWKNLWREGINSDIWESTDPAKNEGNGVKSFGQLLANSKAFPNCMAQRAYKTVCLKDLSIKDATITRLGAEFAKTYNMKELFKEVAVDCGSKIGM